MDVRLGARATEGKPCTSPRQGGGDSRPRRSRSGWSCEDEILEVMTKRKPKFANKYEQYSNIVAPETQFVNALYVPCVVIVLRNRRKADSL